MQNVYLKFYLTEKRHHHGSLLYEWLLNEAMRLGMTGGSAFRAISGFGRHGRLHDETFFELAGELPVQVEFVTDSATADQLMGSLRAHQLNLFYVRYAVEAGVI